MWPAGHIEAIPMKFPVIWRIESPQSEGGIYECRQEEVTPLFTVQAAWTILRHSVSNLAEEPIFDYRGFLQPGRIINVEIPREDVRVSVTFEVIRDGCITFIHEVIPNVVTWREIHGHYSNIDRRICPWECYIDEEKRPYHPETGLRFRLNTSVEIPDTTREFGGVSGGQTPLGNILPPIVFPKPPIDTTSPADPKLSGSTPAPLGSDSSPDSWEEDDISDELSEDLKLQRLIMTDEHKLRKLR
jgi:hypothetical protein